MKRVISWLLICILCVSLVGCGNQAAEAEANKAAELLSSGDPEQVRTLIFPDGLPDMDENVRSILEPTEGPEAEALGAILARCVVSVGEVRKDSIEFCITVPDMEVVLEQLSEEEAELTEETLWDCIIEYAKTAQVKEFSPVVKYDTDGDRIVISYWDGEFLNAMTGGLLSYYKELASWTADAAARAEQERQEKDQQEAQAKAAAKKKAEAEAKAKAEAEEKAPASESESSSWKTAYTDFIRAKDTPEASYDLINLDGDSTPELYIGFGIMAEGALLCTYTNGTIISQPLWACGSSYLEGANLFRDSGGKMDIYFEDIYQIQNGSIVSIHHGDFGALLEENTPRDENGSLIYEYVWDGEDLSEAEYEERLNSAFNEASAQQMKEYTASQIIEKIEAY